MKWNPLARIYRRPGIHFMNLLLAPIEWLITRFSRDGRRTFFDSDSFEWTRAIEAGAAEIRRELDLLMSKREEIPAFADVSENQKYLTAPEHWQTFFLYMYGRPVPENCVRCPDTDRLLKSIPGMKTAMFSILAPGTHIREHFGLYKGVLRFHLGLIVPQPASLCRIRVGPDTRSWAEGRSLIFDDRHPHEVWNDAPSHRTVLFVDFERPLAWPLSLMNRTVLRILSISTVVADAVNRARHIAQRRGDLLD
jgi:aspartyl/asparaginyl beta-hydroxylase (cupin superfamily)